MKLIYKVKHMRDLGFEAFLLHHNLRYTITQRCDNFTFYSILNADENIARFIRKRFKTGVILLLSGRGLK